jgi:hypothetical protein
MLPSTQGLDGRLHVGVDDPRLGSQRRATIQEAARIMGVSEGAIRKRVKRGTLAHDKAEGGRVYVYLDARIDEGVDEVPHSDFNALISELRSHNSTLREQLEAEREANRENRRIIAALTARIPAIEAPQESSESPSEATEQPGRVEPQPSVEGTQQAAQPRSWWRRMFGG